MINVNLIPSGRLAAKQRHARLRVWVALCCGYAVILSAGVGICYAMWARHDTGLSDKIESTARQISESDRAIRKYRRELPQVQAALEASEAMGNQPDWSKLLVLLAEELGEQVVLNECKLSLLDGDVSGGPQTSASYLKEVPLGQRRYKLSISGFGQTQTGVSRFVLRLEHIELFDEVRLMKSDRQPFLTGEAVAFNIECSI